MKNIFLSIADLVAIDYVVAVIIATFIVLYYFISKPPKKWRFAISAVFGLIFGVVWIVYMNASISQIIVSFLFSAGFYTWLKELLFKALNINYNDK
ncbi:MAG: hypothetical protein K9M80_01825 [Candidatus Marinimicrobia bacterium]|nr:hypothetical protein [Candidatus Neomarinimicrobiota bacterium]